MRGGLQGDDEGVECDVAIGLTHNEYGKENQEWFWLLV